MNKSNVENSFISRLRAIFLGLPFVTIIAVSLMPLANASDRPVIRGAYVEFPPLSYTSDSGEPEGTFIDLVEEIADRAGYDITWQGLPVERVYLYLKSGEIDMWPGTAGVPELAAYTRETDFHAGSVRLNAYARDGAEPVSDIDDLRGKSLILIRGYTYWRLLDHLKDDPETQLTFAPSHSSGIRMLKFKRGDYLINFDSPMNSVLKDQPLPGLQHDNLLERPITLVFSRKTPATQKIIDDLNRAWRLMQDDAEATDQ